MAKKKINHSQKHQYKKADILPGIFEVYQQRVNSKSVQMIEYFKRMDYDAIRLKRRISAATNLMPKVKGIVLSMWPDIPHESDIEVDWAHANAQIYPAYDLEERNCSTILGAAIWILDQLRECGKLSEAIHLLPKDNDTLSTIDFPPVRDPYYSEDVLRGMVYILQNRNADCENRTNTQDAEGAPVFMDLNTARKKHRQKVNSRFLFETILGYIPDDSKKAATQEYEDSFWDWVRRYYRCWMIYHKKRTLIDAEQKRIADLTIERFATESSPINSKHLDVMQRIYYRDPTEEHLDADYYDISKKIEHLWVELRDFSICTTFEIEDAFGEVIAELWDGFSIRDPYRYCFAFLYLLDSGSDLPWLYFPGMGLYCWFAARLPWANFDVSEAREYSFTEKDILSQIDFADRENWYELQFEEYIASDYFKYRSLAQIVFNSTGCLIPRKIKNYSQVFPALQYYGKTGNFVAKSLAYIMSILEVSCQHTQYLAIDEEPFASDPAVEDSTDAEFVAVEELQSKVSAMKDEIAELKRSLYELNRELRSEQKKGTAVSEKLALEHQELSDLRALIYHQQENTYQSDEQNRDIIFPYAASNNIVVFGGHDSWLREIRQKVDNVRFIGKDQLPNAEMIRNADMVWIQPNALSHAFFYKIINEVRKYQIPLRYFTYASATKCAEELADADMKYTTK